MSDSPEHQLLFACTRQHFSDKQKNFVVDLCSHRTLDWQDIFSTAQLHGVAPLIYYNLQQCPLPKLGIPANIADLFKQSLMRNMLVTERLLGNARQAVAMFQADGIDVMLVKGGALDLLVYNQPWYTVINDFDMVIRLQRSAVDDEKRRAYQTAMHRKAVEYDYFEHHDVTMNNILPVNFDKIWADAEQVTFKDTPVFVMCPEDFLISVCINSCRKRYFRLKSLCDIAEIINSYPDLNWEGLLERAKTYDCATIVYTALLVTEMTLGCNVPKSAFDTLARNAVRKPLIGWLSGQLSLTAYNSLYSGAQVQGRAVSWPLILPYATLRWYQIWRRLKFAWTIDPRW